MLGVLQASQRFAEVKRQRHPHRSSRAGRASPPTWRRQAAEQLDRLGAAAAARLAEHGGLTLDWQGTLLRSQRQSCPCRPGLTAHGGSNAAGTAGSTGRGCWCVHADGALDYLHLGASGTRRGGRPAAAARSARCAAAPGRHRRRAGLGMPSGPTPSICWCRRTSGKPCARLSRAVLVVDAHSAAVPWELLLAEDPAIGPPSRWRCACRWCASSPAAAFAARCGAVRLAALVIGNPPRSPAAVRAAATRSSPPPEAAEEATQIHRLLQDCGQASTLLVGEEALGGRSAASSMPGRCMCCMSARMAGCRTAGGAAASCSPTT